jgi:hypothetical protein
MTTGCMYEYLQKMVFNLSSVNLHPISCEFVYPPSFRLIYLLGYFTSGIIRFYDTSVHLSIYTPWFYKYLAKSKIQSNTSRKVKYNHATRDTWGLLGKNTLQIRDFVLTSPCLEEIHNNIDIQQIYIYNSASWSKPNTLSKMKELLYHCQVFS